MNNFLIFFQFATLLMKYLYKIAQYQWSNPEVYTCIHDVEPLRMDYTVEPLYNTVHYRRY